MNRTVRIVLFVVAGAIFVIALALGGCGPASVPGGYHTGLSPSQPAPTPSPSPSPSFPVFLIEVENKTSRPVALSVTGVWSPLPLYVATNFASLSGVGGNYVVASPNGVSVFYGGAVPIELDVTAETTGPPFVVYGPKQAFLGVDYTPASTGVRVSVP